MTAKHDPACMGGDRAGVPGRLDKSRQQDALSHSTLQSSTLIFSTFALQSSTLPSLCCTWFKPTLLYFALSYSVLTRLCNVLLCPNFLNCTPDCTHPFSSSMLCPTLLFQIQSVATSYLLVHTTLPQQHTDRLEANQPEVMLAREQASHLGGNKAIICSGPPTAPNLLAYEGNHEVPLKMSPR